MSAEVPGSTQERPARAGWQQWLRFALAALLLLLLSEALWLWQTWTVREVLQPSTATGTVTR